MLEESELIKHAGMEYLKDYELYQSTENTEDNSQGFDEEIKSLEKIKTDQEAKIGKISLYIKSISSFTQKRN